MCKAEALLGHTLSPKLQQLLLEALDMGMQLLRFICGKLTACSCNSLYAIIQIYILQIDG